MVNLFINNKKDALIDQIDLKLLLKYKYAIIYNHLSKDYIEIDLEKDTIQVFY